MEVFTAAELGRMRQAMLLGTARMPMPVPGALEQPVAASNVDPALALLVLAGQRQRFERPEPVAADVPEPARRLHQDPLPVLPDDARRIFGRLLNSVEKSFAASVIPAARRRIALAGFRPHPFDLPALSAYLNNAPDASLSERAYFALTETKPDETSHALYDEEITAENWTGFPKAQRRAFLLKLRASDAEAGRALLEACWPNEQAAMRGELLAVFATGLGAADVPFLEGLARDRAESVRSVASRLLAQIKGNTAYDERLAAAAKCFARAGKLKSVLAKAGLGAGEITFTPPKGATAQERSVALQRLFEGVSLRDLATATDLEGTALLSTLPTIGTATDQLLATAIAASDADTVRLIVEHRILVAVENDALGYHLMQYVAALGSPLSSACAETTLASPGFAKALATFSADAEKPSLKDDGTLVLTAALMPDELMPRYVDMLLLPLLPSAARGARDFAELALCLSAHRASATQPNATR